MQLLSYLVVVAIVIPVYAGEFSTHLIELDGFENRSASVERKIRDLVQQIQITKDKGKIQGLTKEIVISHEEIKKNIRRADKIKHHLRFEHPEKGEAIDAKYPRLDKNRLKILESELGLDKILSQLQKKVNQTFPQPEEETAKPNTSPTSTPNERIKLTK